MRVVAFHPEAQVELDTSAIFYHERLTGLGVRFVAAVEDTVERLAATPVAGSPLGEEHRKRLVSGFPFSVIYRVWEDHIFIVAVAHQHRRPGYWRRRSDHR